MLRLWYFTFVCLMSAVALACAARGDEARGKLKFGRYVGWIDLEGADESLAVTLDTYLDQPDDVTQFPRLQIVFKYGLGGYGTSEYTSEIFENARYDFATATLALDDPANDVTLVSRILTDDDDRTFLEGDVWVRSAARTGTFYALFQSDEPTGLNAMRLAPSPLIPKLAGSYVGHCGSKRAQMQIETTKGGGAGGGTTRGLKGYAIYANLAFDDRSLCGTDSDPANGPVWCAIRSYDQGAYTFFDGTLTLKTERFSDECRLDNGRLTCRVVFLEPTDCEFERSSVTPLGPRFFDRARHVPATAAQRAELPEPSPPDNSALVAALAGQFRGYLHNETTNRYQPIMLNVVATTSTDNPHNENLVYVSSTAVSYFGATQSRDLWTQQFERRSFYLKPGFVLESESSDVFLGAEEWKTGFIRGVWYSHAFGRVGTFELIKGAWPVTPDGVAFVQPVTGEFVGPRGSANPNIDGLWFFRSFLGVQPVGRAEATLAFQGQMNLRSNILPPIPIEEGHYDTYSGAIGWTTRESSGSRMISGMIDDQGQVSLLWPGAAIFGVKLPEYAFHRYDRVR